MAEAPKPGAPTGKPAAPQGGKPAPAGGKPAPSGGKPGGKPAGGKPAGKGKAKSSDVGRRALYVLEGTTLKRLRRACPKCGPGVFLAEHKNRFACGNCKYTEFKK
jgi:ubiquitin-small subunit ribosomal protein S27Ae